MALHQELQAHADFPEDIHATLAQKALLMVVGPAAIGKTHVMQRVAALDERFGLASSLTNRPRRTDDPDGLFRHYYERTDSDTLKLLDKFYTGQLVNFHIHPTELTFYGNEVTDFPYQENMLATLTGAIDNLKARGFGRTAVIGLISSPGDWLGHFNTRYRPRDPSRIKRLEEGRRSINDLLARSDTNWIINRDGHANDAAQDIIHTAEGKKVEHDEALAYAHRIQQKIDDELTRAYTEQNG